MAYFPTSPSDGDTVTVNSISYEYSSANGSWFRTSTAGANTTVLLSGDSGTDTYNNGDTLNFTGTANEIVTAITDDRITFSLPDDVTIGNDLTVTGDLLFSGAQFTIKSTTNGPTGGLGMETAQGTSSTGNLTFKTGTSFSQMAGEIQLRAGDGFTNGNRTEGALIRAKGGSSSTGGDIIMTTGRGYAGVYSGTGSEDGGDITLTAERSSNSGTAGAITLTTYSNGTSGTPGSVIISGTGNMSVAGTLSVAADIAMQGNKVTGAADPTSAQDYATKSYVDTQVSSSGISNIVEDTTPQLGGALDLNGNNITGNGNISITGTITSTGLASLDGGIDVDGVFTVSDTSGNIATTGTLASGAATFSSAQVSDLTTGRVVYVGASGELQDDADMTFNGTALTVNTIEAGTLQAPSSLSGTYSITSPTTITLDPVDEIINDAPMKLVSKTVAQLATLVSSAGAMVYCSNESGGAVPAFYDGTNWRRVTDRAVVS